MSAASEKTNPIRQILLLISAILLLIGLFRIGKGFFVQGELRFGNPVTALGTAREATGSEDMEPRRVRAEVTRVRGNQIVRPMDKCEFLVERRPLDNGTFYCNAQVVCGGKLVYGGPDRGFFSCKLYDQPRRDVVGSDPSTTGEDHDPALSLDTRAGVLRVWDDARGKEGAFELEADVIDVE